MPKRLLLSTLAALALASPAFCGEPVAKTAHVFKDMPVRPQSNPKDGSVKANMRTLQLAAESCAGDHGGLYPTSVSNALCSYFEGGSSDGKRTGKPFINPYTNKPEWPVAGTIKNVALARLATRAPLAPGVVEYSCIGSGKTYAVRGGGADGRALIGPGGQGTLIYSNQNQPGSGQ